MEYNKLEMLTGPNYHIWAIKIKAYLKAKKLFQEVIIDDIPPDSDDKKSKEWKIKKEWNDKNDEAFSTLILSLASDQAGMFADEWAAKNIWEELEKMYAGDKKNKIMNLMLELKEIKMHRHETIDEYFTRIKNIKSKIKAIGGKIEEDEINFHIIRGINDKYENIAVILRTNKNMSLDQIHTALKEEEMRKENENTQHGRKINENAYRTNQYRKRYNNKPNINCYVCGKQGHIAKQCWHNKENYQKQKHSREKTKYNAKTTEHAKVASKTETTYTNKRDEEKTLYALNTTKQTYIKTKKEQNNDEITWHLDSGCSTHMTADKNNLQNIEAYKAKINLAEQDRTIEAEAKGEIIMQVQTNNKPINIKLTNVLYVPQLRDNLLSVKEIVKQGNEVKFNKDGATIYTQENKLIAKAIEINDMYIMKARITQENAYIGKQQQEIQNEKLWHRRLGHLSIQGMIQMERKQLAHGITYDRNKLKMKNCDSCIRGKLTQTPYKKIGQQQSKQILELIHIDLCGPIQTKTLGGSSYIFMIVDDYSRMTFVELLKHKNDAYEKFLNFKAITENETDRKIKRIRSDNGTEFINKEFEELFAKEGIKHEKTTHYSPSSNGVAERANRTILDTARTLLLDAKLPEKFWGEAINTATYIKNRTYKQRLGNKTPIEKWRGKKPTIKHLRTFGCKAYCWIPKPIRHNKLEPRAVQGIFVGYSRTRKAYRIYLPTENKIQESRNVRFVEEEWGIDTINIPNLGKISIDTLTYQNQEDKIQQEEPDQNKETQERKRGRPFGTTKGIVEERHREQNIKKEEETKQKGARRSSRNRETTQNCQQSTIIEENPNNYWEAVNSKNKKEWETAMTEELNSLKEHEVWRLTDKKEGVKILKNRWVYTKKKDQEGNIRYKARLVVVGNKQIKGIDYDESYSPVIKLESVRLIIAIAARLNLKITRYDVKTAYLHGILKEPTYMQQPEGTTKIEGKICQLQKSLYGLPQSGRTWNEKLNDTLTKIGFKRMDADTSVYIIDRGGDFVILGVYVDDCIVTGTNEKLTKDTMKQVQEEFMMREETGNGTFLGINIIETDDGYRIHQQQHIEKLLNKQRMEECNPVKNPMDNNQNLDVYEGSPKIDKTKYQEMIGSLTYIAGGTRPDISCAVNKLSQYSGDPREVHLNAAKRVLRYLKGTSDLSLYYHMDNGVITASSDATWCTTKDARSQSGYNIMLGQALISWKSKKQDLVALSTCESEINAICETLREVKWITNIITEMNIKGLTKPTTTIYTDSKSAIDWAYSTSIKQRTKHFERKCYKIREEIELKNITLTHKPGEDLEADILTKAVTTQKLQRMIQSMGLI